MRDSTHTHIHRTRAFLMKICGGARTEILPNGEGIKSPTDRNRSNYSGSTVLQRRIRGSLYSGPRIIQETKKLFCLRNTNSLKKRTIA